MQKKKTTKGLFTYYVSQKQEFVDPPSPLGQQWSSFGWPPLPPSSAIVSIWMTPPPPLVSLRHLLPDAPFVRQFFTLTFWPDKMGDIHLLGSNWHIIWLCIMFMVKFAPIVLSIHIILYLKTPFYENFSHLPPLVSICQHSAYPPSPPRQQWSAFGLLPLSV